MKEAFRQLIKKINNYDSRFYQDLAFLLLSDAIHSQKLGKLLHFNFVNGDRKTFLSHFSLNISKDKPIATPILPLGKYAEKLIAFYFKAHSGYELFGANIQLIKDKITLGELDFLLRNLATEENIHLEFALKYYLLVNERGKQIYLGPSTKDRLSKKLAHLKNHQLRLLEKHKRLLPSSLQKIDFRAEYSIKGCLFYPFKLWESMQEVNLFNQGWWMDKEEFSDCKKLQTFHFSLIESRKNWIFPFRFELKRYSHDQIDQIIDTALQQKNEMMVVRWGGEEVIDRGMIMRTNWPN